MLTQDDLIRKEIPLVILRSPRLWSTLRLEAFLEGRGNATIGKDVFFDVLKLVAGGVKLPPVVCVKDKNIRRMDFPCAGIEGDTEY
ncbi:hypothetical protein JCM11641_001627 [Rhodosporidiobolus odoratus]